MKHDPERAAQFFDQFAEQEWARFGDPTTPSTSLDVHLEYLRRYVSEGDRVLDVGAGPGRFTIELPASARRSSSPTSRRASSRSTGRRSPRPASSTPSRSV